MKLWKAATCLAVAGIFLPGCVSQSISSCGKPTDHFKNVVMAVSPDPIKRGQGFTITVSGDLDEDIVGGSLNVSLDVKAMRVIDKHIDYSAPFTISPAVKQGKQQLTVGPVHLPEVPGEAKVAGTVSLANSKGEQVFCTNLNMQLPAFLEQLHGPDVQAGYKCSVCQHVYDQAKDGAGKPFEQLPDTWKCPVCGAPKSAYKPMVAENGQVAWVHSPEADVQAGYKCSVCQHVYDAAKDGAGKPFEQLPDTWKCPVCGAPKSAYKPMVAENGEVAWVHKPEADVQAGYKCSVCQHVYDQAKDGAGKPFEQLPDTWKCPVCGAPKSAYKPMVAQDDQVAWVHNPEPDVQAGYKCSVCQHVYDAAKDGAGKPFEQLPDSWKCPVCGAPKSAYKKSVSQDGALQWVHAPEAVTSCGAPSDHLHNPKAVTAGGVTTVTGSLDEDVSKVSVDIDLTIKEGFIHVPFKTTIPISWTPGVTKGDFKLTAGPAALQGFPFSKAGPQVSGSVKFNDGSSQELACLEISTSHTETEEAVLMI